MKIIRTLKHIVNHPLNKKKKLPSLWRFLKWQLGSRLVPGAIIFPWVNNSKIVIHHGETGLTQNIYCGIADFEEMSFLLHVLRKKEIFIDVGANAGAYTVLSSGVIGCKSYSFEPVPSSFERLVMNIRMNNLEKIVVCMNIAIGRTKSEIRMTTDLDARNHVVDEVSRKSTLVKVFPLDEIMVDEAPSVLKIDVEGFEMNVLQGGIKTLRNKSVHSIIIETNENGSKFGFCDDDIYDFMTGIGFSLYTYQPFERILKKGNWQRRNLGNSIFVRDETIPLARIKTAHPFFINGIQI